METLAMPFKLTAAIVPAPVLQGIFRYLATGFVDPIPIMIWFRRSNYAEDITDVAHLYHAALVNKHWSSVATTALYESITIDNRETAEAVCETFHKFPYLASLVRRLDLFQLGMDGDLWQGIELRIWIIRACRNLMHLHVSGYEEGELKYFRPILQGCKHLRSLRISQFLWCDREGDGFCTPSKMLEMMSGWTELERVILNADAFQDGPETYDEPSEIVPLPRLRTFEPGASLSAGNLQTLIRLAPNLQTLSLPNQDDSPLSEALKQWKGTLTDLDLRNYMGVDRENVTEREVRMRQRSYLAEVLPSLTTLHHLQLNPSFPASSFGTAFPDSLRILYVRLDPSDLRLLNSALKRPDYVPNLTQLTAEKRWDWGHRKEFEASDWETLHDVCESRGWLLLKGRW